MKLIVGLGNPGQKYSLNRHNIGFLTVDLVAESLGLPRKWKTEHEAHTLKAEWQGHSLLIAKPQTFMNLSGKSVSALLNYYGLSANSDLLVIHDEIEQAFGTLKFVKNRGHGGNNGVRSIQEELGSQDYARLRLGVGRPSNPQMEVSAHVLQNFTADEQRILAEQFFNIAVEAVFFWIESGYDKSANMFNNTNVMGSL